MTAANLTSPQQLVGLVMGTKAIRRPLFVAIGILALKLAFVLRTPLRSLAMTPWLIDDSFIIMRIARNLALGRGYSFDGVSPTTGAPPIWALVTALNHLFLDPEAAARATVVESGLLGAACTLAVFTLACRCCGRRVAWAAFALATLLPPLSLNAVNGMETSLFTLVGLLALNVYFLHLHGSPKRRGNRGYFALGLLLGLENLVRADGVFLALAVIVVEACLALRAGAEARGRRMLRVGALITGTSLVTLLLVAWSYGSTGRLLPANQVGRRALAWDSIWAADGTILWPAYRQQVVHYARKLAQLLTIVSGWVPLAGVAALAALRRSRSAGLGWVALVYVVAYSGTLVAYQGYFPDVHGLRYLNLAGHLVSILVAALLCDLASLVGKARPAQHLLVAAALGLLLVSSASAYQRMVARLRWTTGMRTVPVYPAEQVGAWWGFLDWAVGHLPAGTVVAAKDHGRLAYFTTVQVVDLAGIIDPAVTACLDERRIGPCLASMGVQYVLLPKEGGRPVHEAIRKALRLEPVPEAPPQECTGYQLYRVVW